MRRKRWAMYLWPGLRRLWLEGSWSGLAVAIAAAVVLNLALWGSFGFGELLGPGWRRALWISLAATWVVSGILSWLADRRRVLPGQPCPAAPGLEKALEHYLKGDWFQAERLLVDLLHSADGDLEARLMLATLLRHTGRLDEAAAQLDRLTRIEGAGKWEWEIGRERELLSRAREKRDRQDTGSDEQEESGRSPTDPPAEMTHAA